MVDFGNSFKVSGIVISGLSLSMVILLNSLARLAYEDDPSFWNQTDVTNVSNTKSEPDPQLVQGTTEPMVNGFPRSQCRKFIMYFAKKMIRLLTKCQKDLKTQYNGDQEEYQKHFNCALRCVMVEVKLVNERYQMTNETIVAFMEEWVPEKYRQLSWHFGLPCAEQWGPKLMEDNEYCKNYGEMVQCLQNAVADC